MEDKIKKIMQSVFEIEPHTISSETSPDTVENWDSLRHMNLIVALEDEFAVEIDDDDITEMMDYTGIIINMQKLVDSNK